MRTGNIENQQMPDLTGFVTTKEAAQDLGFHVNHIRRMVKRGDLQFKWVGHMLFISQQSLDYYKERTKDFGKHDRRKRESTAV